MSNIHGFRFSNLPRIMKNSIKTSDVRVARQSMKEITMVASSGENGGVEPLSPDRYTEKAWEALTKLPMYAEKYKVQYIEAPLILKGLLDDGPGGLTQRILIKSGTDVKRLER